ncbi:MAG: fibronectin type III domain-containing protein, partial [Ginsengibacter sp.]
LSLGFGALSGPNFASLAANVIAAMTGNIYFPTPIPAIAGIQELLTNYNTAAAAAAGRDRDAVMTKTLARLALTQALQDLGRYCMSVANGDKQSLSSTAFPLNKRGSLEPPPIMPAPTNLQVVDGPVPFSILVSVDGNILIKSYTFQYTSVDPALPQSVWSSEFATTSEYVFFNLQPATRYWFRVVAVGTRKQIKFSDIKSRLVQ